MHKVNLLFVYLLGAQTISAASTTPATTEATTTWYTDVPTTSSTNECLYKNELWPSVDATKFYFCLPDSDTPVLQSCSTRTLFLKNQSVSGCVPLADVPETCVYHDSVAPCSASNFLQPQKAQYPTNYYLCISQTANPIKMTCPAGKAFVHEKGYLGCFEWAEWRAIRGCTLNE